MWLTKKNKRALYEALEKIKSELMLLGFISLLLTAGQGPISNICITECVGNTWHPCIKKQETKLLQDDHGDHENTTTTSSNNEHGHRRLLSVSSDSGDFARRVLAAARADKCAAKA